jgi:hypothetical protein
LTALTNALVLSEGAQRDFLQSNGFTIVAYLLGSNSPQNLTYDLYSHFLVLLNLTDLPEPKRSILDQILLNTSLWVLAPAAQLDLIIDHWLQVLFPGNQKLILQLRPVSKLVADLPEFYWRCPNDEVARSNKIHSQMLHLICKVAEWRFLIGDLKAIISSCVASPDPDFSQDLLFLIRLFAHIADSVFKRFGDQDFYPLFVPLTFLLQGIPHPDIVYGVLDTYLTLHEKHLLTTPPLSHHLSLLLAQISPRAFQPRLVETVLIASTTHPKVLAVVFSIVLQTGGDNLTSLLEGLRPDPAWQTDKQWALLPLAIAVRFGTATDFMLDFVVRSGRSHWNSIYSTLECACAALSVEPERYQRKLLTLIGRLILSDQCQFPGAPLKFVSLARFFILTKPIDCISPAIMAVYSESPFIHDVFDISYSPDSGTSSTASESTLVPDPRRAPIESNFSDSLFYHRLAQFVRRHKFVKFGIAMTEDGKWADEELATIICDVIEKVNLREFRSLKRAISGRKRSQMNDLYKESRSFVDLFVLQPRRIGISILQFHMATQEWAQSHSHSHSATFMTRAYAQLGEDDRHSCISKAEAAKHWSRLWHQLTFDRAPWRKTLPDEEVHYKLDSTLLRDFCPAMLKRDAKFSDHVEASISRDIGSATTARAKIDEYRHQLAEQQQQRALPQLLDVSETTPNAHRRHSQAEDTEDDLFSVSAARYMKVTGARNCSFLLSRTRAQVVFAESEHHIAKIIEAQNVAFVLLRCYLHRPNSFEIVLKSGKSCFVSLIWRPALPLLNGMRKLLAWRSAMIQTVPHRKWFADLAICEKWTSGLMSNFQYLMQLNIFGGRSFIEPSLYPVFPWVLRDYTSSLLDLSDPSIFRDLSRPIGTFSEERLADLQSRLDESRSFDPNCNFLYGASYTSPFLVYLWLIRVEPFTTLNIDLQSGKFDHAARLFSSVPKAFAMACTQVNDYRELIPEFFFNPTFLENANRFDLGKVDGRPVDNVVLPKWSRSAINFVYVHRKAFESRDVSSHLNEWIDLIWGCKQKGDDAKEAKNTFDPSLYETVWDDEASMEPGRRDMVASMMEHAGHIPNQLFFEPHSRKAFPPVHSFSAQIKPNVHKTRFGHVSRLGSHVFRYLFLGPQNCFYEVTWTITGHGQVESLLKMFMSIHTITFSQIGLFGDFGRLVAVTDIGSAVTVDPKTGTVVSLGKRIISCLAASRNFVVTGGQDTITDIWDVDTGTGPIHSITSFRGEIVCVAMCDEFKLAASSTRDGSISLISTSTGTTSRVIEIAPKSANLLQVTTGWGFIVAHTSEMIQGIISYFIEVYTVNGDIIRRRPVTFAIKAWTQWCSIDGFDYFLVVSEKGDLYTFEAFYLDIDQPFAKVAGEIVTLKYFVEENVLAVATESQVFFFSHGQMKMERFDRTKFRIEASS